MTDKLSELAGRCEDHAESLISAAFAGYDNMRLGKMTLREALAEAADAFAVAAALRAQMTPPTNRRRYDKQ
jgi:hypothetical protein